MNGIPWLRGSTNCCGNTNTTPGTFLASIFLPDAMRSHFQTNRLPLHNNGSSYIHKFHVLPPELKFFTDFLRKFKNPYLLPKGTSRVRLMKFIHKIIFRNNWYSFDRQFYQSQELQILYNPPKSSEAKKGISLILRLWISPMAAPVSAY